MKVLVTGATGFVGNYVIQNLLDHKIDVIATSTNIEKAKTFDWYSKITFIPYTIVGKDLNNLYHYFNAPDKIIHLAWKGLPNYTEIFHFTENLMADFEFIKNLVDHGANDISITGTCFEYGLQEGCLKEDLYTLPNNYYALAKDTLHKSLILYQNQKPFELKWIRLFYMYGIGQNSNSLIAQLDKAIEEDLDYFNMSGGEQLRDYLPIEKVADNIVTIALQNKTYGIINNCSGSPISVKDFVENYLREKNKKIKLNLGFYPYSKTEPMQFWGDASKMKNL
jgi:nucleoside-diphosphate-sugar epimerase